MKKPNYQVARLQKIAGILRESVNELDYQGGLRDPYQDTPGPSDAELEFYNYVESMLEAGLERMVKSIYKDSPEGQKVLQAAKEKYSRDPMSIHDKYGIEDGKSEKTLRSSIHNAIESLIQNTADKLGVEVPWDNVTDADYVSPESLEEEDTTYDTDWQGAYDSHIKTAVEAIQRALDLGQGEITSDSVLSDIKKALDLASAEYNDSELPFNETELPAQRVRSAGELTVDKHNTLRSAIMWGIENLSSEGQFLGFIRKKMDTGGSTGFGSNRKPAPLPLNDRQKESVLQYAAEEYRSRRKGSNTPAPKV